MILDRERCKEAVRVGARPTHRGRVSQVTGLIVEARGLPAAVGELCRIDRDHGGPIEAEVVGFRGATALLMPQGELDGIAPDQSVVTLDRPFAVGVGPSLLGRVLDGFGRPIDEAPRPESTESRRVRASAPAALSRALVREPLQTGVRVLDAFCTLGRGQRLGIFAGSGAGKSTLLGQVSRGTEADVIVCALVGERGREVREFLHNVLGEERLARSVVFVATSDRPPIERFTAPFTAVTAAEYFRDQGLNVLFVMDSMTRFAAASREIGLAAGEPPTLRGYPPSFFATVPKLVERLGPANRGSITGLITVLLDGDDPNEPVADTLRGLLDGHVFLSREIAQGGRFPAVDVLASLSRLQDDIVTPEHRDFARELRRVLAAWQEGRDLVEIGAYRAGASPALDRAIQIMPAFEAFLSQAVDESSTLAETLAGLQALVAAAGASQ